MKISSKINTGDDTINDGIYASNILTNGQM